MLCETGIASMAELLDPEGIWTMELLQLMIPVALDVTADRTSAMFGAVSAAVSMIGGSQGAKSFMAGLQKTKDAARDALRQARGLPPKKRQAEPGEDAATKFMEVLRLMGITPPKRHKKKPGTIEDTRKH